ncbi:MULTISPECIES: SGNH/GDSL hydrolase family protein [unclassified Bradyrhizobium]|uniref:SGNH/GDSL hydrolase family protein n=1 Tax=unclassified Bradyrhizobium TaxID=2631580 RepID=UPI0028EC1541|nr:MULTISPECIES: SGNH/GDSL hydrolase family protein [unclassified Bradyrhizobium]
MRATLSASDPFTLVTNSPGLGLIPSYYNTDSKAAVALDLTKNNCVLVVFGESHSASICPTAYTPANSHVLNFCIQNGGTYALTDPPLGCTYNGAPYGPGNAYSRLADAVQGTGKYDNTILVSAGLSGTTITQWGTDLFTRIGPTFRRLSSRGLTATAAVIHIGSNDCGQGTSQAAYAIQQANFIALVRGAGYAGPIFLVKNTMSGGITSSGIQAAQTGAVYHPAGIWLGGDCDSLTVAAGYRQTDQTHLNDAGAAALAALNLAALQAAGIAV